MLLSEDKNSTHHLWKFNIQYEKTFGSQIRQDKKGRGE